MKLAVSEANPATIAPISAVTRISKKVLSLLKINKETRCARISSLLLLIQKLIIPQSKNNAVNPEKNETKGICRITALTKNATTAILHHGKYRQAQKLKSIISNMATRNFMMRKSIKFYR